MKIGKISTIKKEIGRNAMQTMEGSLYQHNMTRMPGTGVLKYPYKELDGKYRTGLDPTAAYIRRIQDPTERDIEIERINKTLERLKESIGDIDLSPRSKFWNYSLSTSTDDNLHVKPVKLLDGDNLFDFEDPFKEITFNWLRAHPTIASSFQAWERGEYPADTQFYVVDDDVENLVIFKKKQLINKAIAKFDEMSPEKKRKVARLLGLPVTENSKEEEVYNMVDNLIKDKEFKKGAFAGLSTIDVFNRFANMKEDLLAIKDLVKQAIANSVYRQKPNGKIYEGELEIAENDDELVKYLMDEDNQSELLTLQGKLKIKKIAAV